MSDNQTTISIATFRKAVEALLAYVPRAQRETAASHALAITIGDAYPPIRK